MMNTPKELMAKTGYMSVLVGALAATASPDKKVVAATMLQNAFLRKKVNCAEYKLKTYRLERQIAALEHTRDARLTIAEILHEWRTAEDDPEKRAKLTEVLAALLDIETLHKETQAKKEELAGKHEALVDLVQEWQEILDPDCLVVLIRAALRKATPQAAILILDQFSHWRGKEQFLQLIKLLKEDDELVGE